MSISISKFDLGHFKTMNIARRMRQFSYTMIDQAVYSLAGFAMNLWLIKYLTIEDYGRFALAFTLFLMASGIHNAFILEPLSVYGSSVSRSEFGAYLGRLLILHFAVCLSLSILAIVSLLFIQTSKLTEAILAVSFLLPGILLIWLMRRVYHIIAKPEIAALGSLVYLLVLTVLLVIVTFRYTLSVPVAFRAMAAAALVASVTIVPFIPGSVRQIFASADWSNIRSLTLQHWRLGRWVALQGVFHELLASLGVLVAGAAVGVSAAGALRALSMFTMPFQQATAAIGGQLALPRLSRDYVRGDIPSIQRKVIQLTVFFGAIGVAFVLVLLAAQQPLAEFVGESSLIDSTWLIPLVGVSALIRALAGGMGVGLRATQKVAYYPLSTAVPGIIGAVMTPILVLKWDLPGAVASQVIIACVIALLNWRLYTKWI